MSRIQTKPVPTPPSAPTPEPFSSGLFFYLHLGVTALLLLTVGVVIFLAATGWLHLGTQATAVTTDREKVMQKEKEKTKTPEEVAGRYQIESLDDARQILGDVGGLGVFAAPAPGEQLPPGVPPPPRIREAWVFRYKGGFVECKLETEIGGRAFSSGSAPAKWDRFLDEETIRKGKAGALQKEGHIVLLGMIPTVSIDEALEPFHPHLGAMFTVGPAGPLHGLVPCFLQVERRYEYRLFLSAGPPKDQPGEVFSLWMSDPLPIRSRFLTGDGASDPPPHTLVGKNLDPGKELTILERQRGLSTIRLKIRFLTDTEVVEKANAK